VSTEEINIYESAPIIIKIINNLPEDLAREGCVSGDIQRQQRERPLRNPTGNGGTCKGAQRS